MSEKLQVLQQAEALLDQAYQLVRQFIEEMPSTVSLVDGAWTAVSSMAIALERYELQNDPTALDTLQRLEQAEAKPSPLESCSDDAAEWSIDARMAEQEARIGLELIKCRLCCRQFTQNQFIKHSCEARRN